jgi:hypothetical protein
LTGPISGIPITETDERLFPIYSKVSEAVPTAVSHRGFNDKSGSAVLLESVSI